ncbi:hypothetical protein SVAN01_00134 [Stagonosporopsis vannaccii]|nr:hypothetical protein SVAN01_00134 [Stagonosporopsis vannaccii]
MFYSHEVLTNRKYGVATVWLVATLGAKSSLKRITRKQMLAVDVPKACKTIVDPAAPLALRLQSSLLYGVSRVYLQQCGYVLADAQSAHSTMMLALRSITNHALDPDAGKARPEQLVLQDDLSFLPEFALPPPELLVDLGLGVDLDSPRSGQYQSLTPFGSRQSSQSSHANGFGLVLPSSTPDRLPAVGLEGDYGGQGDDLLNIENLLQLEEPDFTFGEDGDIIELTPRQHARGAFATPTAVGISSMHSDTAVSARVRQEHKEGRQLTHMIKAHPSGQMEMDLPTYGDDLPDTKVETSTADQWISDRPEVIESSSSIAAPMRRKPRSAKSIPKDTRLELRNSELVDWNTKYLQNMEEAARSKIKSRMQQRAKKNAEHYVWRAGIGGLGCDPFATQGPLNRFMGDNLYQLFTGISRTPTSTAKRNRDNGIDEATQEEPLCKRQKTVEPEEVGRGPNDETLFMLGGDEEVELPREAAAALDDQQIFSAMPWNISASKRGSSAIPLSGRVTMLSEQGRTGSRMVSASPLLRRSTGHVGDFEALQSQDSDALGGDDFAYAAPTSDPAETRESAVQPSLRVREALSAEGGNFFAFVTEAFIEKCNRALSGLNEMADEDQMGHTEASHVTFEELLPPHQTHKIVASQGFLMLLSLGTKGLLDVQQPIAFEDITMKPTEKVKAMHNVDPQYGDGAQVSDKNMAKMAMEAGADEEEDASTRAGDKEAPEPDHSHFQEQMEAGHANNDDHDSLYYGH